MPKYVTYYGLHSKRVLLNNTRGCCLTQPMRRERKARERAVKVGRGQWAREQGVYCSERERERRERGREREEGERVREKE